MVERCLKEENGSCLACPVLTKVFRMVDNTVPYQRAIEFVSKTDCHPGYEPSVTLVRDEKGVLMKKIIEGIEV